MVSVRAADGRAQDDVEADRASTSRQNDNGTTRC